VIAVVMWAAVVGTFLLPTLSDRVGLRKVFYFPGILATGLLIFLAAYALGPSLWIVALLWGFLSGAAALAFVVPLEMDGVGPLLAGSAIGVAASAGYLGGFTSPLIGMQLVKMSPVVGFAFWGGCYALSALLFLLLKETGPRARQLP
jgi:MFS family permease